MNETPDEVAKVYEINTLEQLRAIADPLRLTILERLLRRAMTVTQLGDALEIAPAKVHYHVRELERVGLLRLVQTREKGGILEKYYRAMGEDIQVSRTLLSSAPADDTLAALSKIFDLATRDFLAAAARALQAGALGSEVQGLTHSSLWMTPDEVRALLERMEEMLKPYEQPRGVAGEREWTYFRTIHAVRVALSSTDRPAAPALEEAAAAAARDAQPASPPTQAPPTQAPPTQAPPTQAPRRRAHSAGQTAHYSRADLEWLAASGMTVDLDVPGACSFADDVTPALVERVVKTFRCGGPLSASPEVRQVLARKGMEA